MITAALDVFGIRIGLLTLKFDFPHGCSEETVKVADKCVKRISQWWTRKAVG